MTYRPQHFQTTRWSLVRSAHRRNDGETSRNALAELCDIYWYPLYAFARRKGAQVADAQEQVQEFFTQLLSGSFFEKADAQRGKFRSFLLKSFSHFLSDQRRRDEAVKRGGGAKSISIDVDDGEQRYQHISVSDVSADQLFERQWAVTLLNSAMSRLRSEYVAGGKEKLFERLIPHLTQESDAKPYAQIAESLTCSETAVKVAAYRLKKKYRDALRSEIADTIQGASEADIDEELRWLISTLAG